MDRRHRSDKYLISEQPGMKILLTGLILAFLIGYTTKSLLSPARIKSQLEKAASHIHKDIKVSFDSAELSLADGILPRFAVVIKQVRMESDQACWMSPVLEIDEMRLPVSVWGLITRNSPIKTVDADNMKLTLRGTVDACEKEKNALQDSTGREKEPSPLVTLSPSEQADKYRNDIRGLNIQSFKIISAQYPQYPSELLNFRAYVKSFEPRVVEVHAKTNFLKDDTVGDYLSHANLFLEYKEVPEQSLQAHFFGNWREGHYSVIAHYSLADHLLNVETDMKHIPLSQVLQVLQKYDLVSKDLNGKQVWVSAKARMTGEAEKLKSAPLEVKDFRIEGDLGEMSVDQASFTSIDPLKYKPFLIDIQNMRIDKLMNFINRPQKARNFGDLGSFTGQAEFVSEKDIRLVGEHQGLQFIFANKGQRELQYVDRISGSMSLKGDTWNIAVNRAEPRGGSFIGNVKVKADRDFKDVTLNANIDELTLAPAVQAMMTGGGEIGVLSVNAEARTDDGKVSYVKGTAQLNMLDVEGMTFGKAKAKFDLKQKEVVVHAQVQSLEVEGDSAGSEVLSGITPQNWWVNQKLGLKDLHGELHWNNTDSLQWIGFEANAGKGNKITSSGSWNEFGQLRGTVSAKDGKAIKKFQIEGHRDLPKFTEEVAKGKK
ncbi:hypothetical protein B9G69_012275 [Bdellovibrio sp. SKB1291214]|uniref:hypothetical protein n=1 Tax=Bdellovibrio sp. SKB1291214 TaxID=1732569 RepID=UPI000B51B130|nr:hypothetical protein [Bdellovibrio sp. SKB1291214]UYL07822.1 hypothetical protein B9G69_012275 [Bdellovibrio sp. SKB1291214]